MIIEPLAKFAFSSLDLEIRFFSKIGFLIIYAQVLKTSVTTQP
jgi:hypothetical protein